MEFKNCEEYVLAKLQDTENQLEEVLGNLAQRTAHSVALTERLNKAEEEICELTAVLETIYRAIETNPTYGDGRLSYHMSVYHDYDDLEAFIKAYDKATEILNEIEVEDE